MMQRLMIYVSGGSFLAAIVLAVIGLLEGVLSKSEALPIQFPVAIAFLFIGAVTYVLSSSQSDTFHSDARSSGKPRVPPVRKQ